MEKFQGISDEELIVKYREKDKAIIDYLLNKYKPLVRKRANVMYLMGGETDDLIQEGMIGLFKAIRDFNPNKETSFFHFADLCITRQLYTAVEASNRKKHIPLNNYISFSQNDENSGIEFGETLEGADSGNPEKIFIEQETTTMFYTKLSEKLSKLEKEVLDYYIAGQSYVQIAEIMNKSPKSIDNALQRIKQKVSALNL
ncbi:RNA polymerase sporulation-specific sigma factor [Lachnospiraceae bacterium C7]|nr:RNA polymerase sporulation-specific sigma factor [Lachnospiraceae bacterium C7]